ncbi:hypothetical protein PVAND_000534 [Polypedilum vanderplanki]|uniref:EF-hand domain-containing protein n=1 Tax=Polypedilum vanderplanki TaxID=319348 RepID=A0A9J6BK39_POLVA|nr:hypothetical protein PVAND_000534 [Polypedilum vanderplanki]
MEEVKLDKIREFVNRPYRPPKPVSADDPTDIQDLDEIKLHELKECFTLFDQNNDGFIDADDLRQTFKTMGMEADDKVIESMIADASQPINFDSFAMMMCFKTMELEPEIVLLEALSKWDERIQGVISLERIFAHLTTYNNDRLSVEEAKEVINEAPLMQTKEGLRGLESPTDSWIDYLLWVEKFAGFRKPRAANYSI